MLGLALVAYLAGVEQVPGDLVGTGDESAPSAARGAPESVLADPGADALGDAAIRDAFAQRRSDLVVELRGTVDRILRDDLDGSRHQRFILRLGSGHTLLVAHNIDLAPRVPLERGADLRLRGEYEWNERGGVLHWTHHDPDQRRPGGWIRLDGRTYR